MQCDPTVIYALERAGKYNGNLTREDLQFDSPYNTYRYAGPAARTDRRAGPRVDRGGVSAGRRALPLLRQPQRRLARVRGHARRAQSQRLRVPEEAVQARRLRLVGTQRPRGYRVAAMIPARCSAGSQCCLRSPARGSCCRRGARRRDRRHPAYVRDSSGGPSRGAEVALLTPELTGVAAHEDRRAGQFSLTAPAAGTLPAHRARAAFGESRHAVTVGAQAGAARRSCCSPRRFGRSHGDRVARHASRTCASPPSRSTSSTPRRSPTA